MNQKQFDALSRRDFIRRAACAAVGTVAMSAAIRDLRFMNAAVAQTNITDYKALVCIFLAGGNDANNLIVPTSASEYAGYAAIRTPILALPNADGSSATLQQLMKPGGGIYEDATYRSYGLHPACPELATLFNEGKLAALFNVGTLVFPMTRAQYLANSVKRPPQLFSHSDQVTQWQTSIPDQQPLTGWGGRCADLLNAANINNAISLSVSLAGANTFEIGNAVSQYAVSTSGAISLANVSGARLAALTNLLALPHPNMQASAYAGIAAHSINTGALLNNAITNTAPAGYWTNPFPTSITVPNGGTINNSTLSAQLKMVARLIEAGYREAAAGGFGMKRQIFFCQVGGYDLHSGQTTTGNVLTGAHANLLAELSQSLNAFQRAMEQLNLANNVTAFTASDFGRTFPCNGLGSDHGWGSHHLICGGAVKGGKTYGNFPTLTINGPDDTSTGRWIPTTATDQYFAKLAQWFGVDAANLGTIFPNLGRFSDINTPSLDFI
jgi:uncharacterized protein (DUF1501 family)